MLMSKSGSYFNRKLETVVWRCSLEKVFLEISKNLQENNCVRVSLPPVAASNKCQ